MNRNTTIKEEVANRLRRQRRSVSRIIHGSKETYIQKKDAYMRIIRRQRLRGR